MPRPSAKERAKERGGRRSAPPTDPAARTRLLVAIGGPSAVFAVILAGAVQLKKKRQRGELKADAPVEQDAVDRAVAVGATALFGVLVAWLVAKQLVWFARKSRELYAAMEAERALHAAARAERLAARAERKAQRAARGERDSAASAASLAAEDMIESMRASANAAISWLRKQHAPLPKDAHVPSSAPVRPSRGASGGGRGGGAGGRGNAGGHKPRHAAKPPGARAAPASGARWSRRRAEAAAAAYDAAAAGAEGEGGVEEDWGAWDEALNGAAEGGGRHAGAEEGEEEEGEGEGEGEEHAGEEDDADAADAVRVPLDLAPAAAGTCVRAEGVTVGAAVASVQPAVLALALRCTACAHGFTTSVELSAMDERAAAVRIWCERCAALLGASLRPALLSGAAGGALAHVDTEGCALADVLPASSLLAACLPCGAETALTPLQRNRRAEAPCRGCHAKLAFSAKELRLEVLSAPPPAAGAAGGARRRGGGAGGGSFDAELAQFRERAARAHGTPTFAVGTPLPQRGACAHFKRSFRWLRFPCCGRALPCPACHEDSGCPAAELGARANTMICGLCSREQPFTNGACECGAAFTVAFSANWNGGAGCRDSARLSKKDSRKHAGAHKTVSNKANRVGPKAKRPGG